MWAGDSDGQIYRIWLASVFVVHRVMGLMGGVVYGYGLMIVYIVSWMIERMKRQVR